MSEDDEWVEYFEKIAIYDNEVAKLNENIQSLKKHG
jgi:hypothetical protein